MTLLIDPAVGLVVACTVYGFYVLFSRGEFLREKAHVRLERSPSHAGDHPSKTGLR